MGMSPRLLRPRATGFNPKSIANLTGWWDAADTASITLNGSTVSEWRDKSGGGRHMTQGTAANQPTYVLSDIGGKAAVRVAAASTNRMNSTSPMSVFANDTSQLLTMFVVLKGGNVSTNAKNIGETDNATGFGWYCRFTDGTSYFDAGDSSTARVGGLVSSALYTSGFVLTGRRSGGQVDQWANGSLISGSRSNATGNIQTNAGNLFSIRGGSVTVSFAEILAFARDLTTSERQQVERYLGKKYGVTVA